MAPKAEQAPPTDVVTAIESGQMVQRGFISQLDASYHNPGAAVGTIEHHIHLQNALTHLRLATSLLTDRTMSPLLQTEFADHQLAANAEFALAAGGTTLRGIFSYYEQSMAGAVDGQLFAKFFAKFASRDRQHAIERLQENQIYRRELVDHVRILQWGPQTELNKQQGHRPYQVNRPDRGNKTRSPAEEGLERRARLVAVQEDPRAGGLPTTARELNTVISFLDYFDNDEFPFKANNQLMEVYRRTQKLRRRAENDDLSMSRPAVSITHEIGDYLINAIASRKALEALEMALYDAVNLRVTIGEEEDLMAPELREGLIALIRFRDITEFKKTGAYGVLGDPLATKEDRRTRRRSGTEKDKTVEDSYTQLIPGEGVKEKLDEAIVSMTVGEARKLIVSAVNDQVLRESLHRQLLEIIATPNLDMPAGPRKLLADTSLVAHERLEESVALARG